MAKNYQLIMKTLYLLLIIPVCFLSCSAKVDLDKIVLEFSEIQCRAIVLKDKRFQLAEHLRSIELDSIHKKMEIDSLQVVIDDTKNKSLILADSIKVKLGELFKNTLSDPYERKEFSTRLEKYIRLNGCTHQ